MESSNITNIGNQMNKTVWQSMANNASSQVNSTTQPSTDATTLASNPVNGVIDNVTVIQSMNGLNNSLKVN